MPVDPWIEEQLAKLARRWVAPGPDTEDQAARRTRWECATELLNLLIDEGAHHTRCLRCGEETDAPLCGPCAARRRPWLT